MRRLVFTLVLVAGCAHKPAPTPDKPRALPQRHVARTLASVEVVYHGEQPFARRGTEEWSLGELRKSDMIFSPDGRRFAFARPPAQGKDASKTPHRLVVRNVAGDPVNEFPLYRAGRPESITWLGTAPGVSG